MTFATTYTRWAICPHCAGEGRRDHPAFSNGFTSSEWADLQDDRDDFDGTTAADRYLRGDYDVPCRECAGSGKVREPDFARMPFSVRRAYVRQLRAERQDAADLAQMRAEQAAERRMGA